jgi:hypothetical protein
MQLAIFEGLFAGFASLDVAIHKGNCNEKSLVTTEVRESNVEDFAHPIDHSCAEVSF